MRQERQKTKMPLADRVYHLLYSRISNGDYPSNQKLPPELELAEEFGVSRPVVRAALDKLRLEGLVYSRQGAGSYVKAPTTTPVGFARVETLADIQRCYEFRLTIECEAARLAAQRRNTAALKRIEDALALLDAATVSLQHREDADFAFHLAITQAANNHYYEASMRALREHIHVGMKMHGQALMTDGAAALKEVFAEHSAIYEAIKSGNPDEADHLMKAHLERSRDRLFGGRLLDLSL